MKEQFHQFAIQHPEFAGLAAEVITAVPRVKIENIDQLEEMRKWLRHGSLVVYGIPHTCMYDSAIVNQRILRQNQLIPSSPDQFAWLISAKFFEEVDGVPKMGTAGAASGSYSERMGYQMLRIYQEYILEGLQGEERENADDTNFASVRKAMRMLKIPGTIVGVLPEGTRGDTGGLLRGHQGIRFLLREKNAIALPIILSDVWRMQARDKEGLDGLHPFIRIQACIGEPINYQKAEEIAGQYRWKDDKMGEFTIADALMMHAAAHGLSEWKPEVDPRGVYAWENIISRLPTSGV